MIQQQTRSFAHSCCANIANPASYDENTNAQIYRVRSKCLNEIVYINDLTTKDETSLRSLYFELHADRHSMMEAEKMCSHRLRQDDFKDEGSREYERNKLHRIRKKMSIYMEFCRSIRLELNLRLAIDSKAKLKLALEARRAGLTQIQINTLLDSSSTRAGLLEQRVSIIPTTEDRQISLEKGISALRSEMMRIEMMRLLIDEFEPSEIESIESEAQESINRAFDWERLGLLFSRCSL